MFGDDPDPTVMTERDSFRTCARDLTKGHGGKGENEEQGWSRNGQRKQGGRGHNEQMRVLKTMTATSVDAMRMMPR